MNFSTWDSIPTTKRYNPSLSPAHVTVEFERTKRPKIFAHKLGNINFSTDRDINSERQKVIEAEKGNITLNGFKYKNIGHVYSDPVIITPTNTEDAEYNIYAHGHPLGGTERGGLESCSSIGLQCSEGNGSDSLCLAGKCIIGTLKQIKNTKWRYESSNLYGSQNLPAVYYVPAEESVRLKPILRGYYATYSGNNATVKIAINKPASIATKIYLPPKFYYSEDFLDSLLIYKDDRLRNISNETGIESRKEKFIRTIVLLAYPNATQTVISSEINQFATIELKDALIKTFEKAPEVWSKQCNLIIEEEYLYRVVNDYSGVEYISAVYDRISELFSSIIQITESSLSISKISYDKERIARPIYSRLPGISESYRSDPAFSDKETPSQWITSGADDFLSKKKDSIATFYQNYLNPETCSAQVLDWLAQHVGLTGELWNTEWDRKIKEAMIRNAFGWWDREIEDGLGNLTPKGEALNKFPFTNQEWTESLPSTSWSLDSLSWDDDLSWGGETDNLLKIKLDEIESIKILNNEIVKTSSPVSLKSFYPTEDGDSIISIVNIDAPKINKSSWNGLIEAKGSLLAVMFLISMFGLKAHSTEELEIVDLQRGIFKPKTGLRNAEISAPPLLPHKYDVIQVGTHQDAEIGNYTNQLVAGISRVSSVQESRNIFFRVPYYYNRDGKSWDRVTYIARNWMPTNLNVRVQYPYLSAGLWAVGDAFFEPTIVEEI